MGLHRCFDSNVARLNLAGLNCFCKHRMAFTSQRVLSDTGGGLSV